MKSQLILLVLDDQRLIHRELKPVLHSLAHDIKILSTYNIHTVHDIDCDRNGVDLILLDLDIPRFHETDLVTNLVKTYPRTPVVAFSDSKNVTNMRRVFDAGGLGYILKSTAEQTMLCAIRLILSGGMYVPPEFFRANGNFYTRKSHQDEAASSFPATARDLPMGLTPRQFDIVCHVVGGRSNKSIANMLNMSQNTVKTHLSNIFKTMSVANRTQVALALENLGWDIKQLAK